MPVPFGGFLHVLELGAVLPPFPDQDFRPPTKRRPSIISAAKIFPHAPRRCTTAGRKRYHNQVARRLGPPTSSRPPIIVSTAGPASPSTRCTRWWRKGDSNSRSP